MQTNGTNNVPTNVCSIVETTDGSIFVEKIGTCNREKREEVPSGPFVVLYQRGMLTNPDLVERSHQGKLSTFKIACSGHGLANVPWHRFLWLSKNKEHAYVRRTKAGCKSNECSVCFDNVKVEHIKVVWLHAPEGRIRFQWYVAFAYNGGVLTRVPRSVVKSITKFLAEQQMDGCICGKCTHPILSMLPSIEWDVYTEEFCEKAVRLFSKYKRQVHGCIQETRVLNASVTGGTHVQGTENMEKETCAVCLEEADVAKGLCVKQTCSLRVCTECHRKTMGLCPLCDRSKLSTNATFSCNVCGKRVRLKHYGFECATCKRPELCKGCYKSFSQCQWCELETWNDSTEPTYKRRRVCNILCRC